MKPIDLFQDEYHFLSNFHTAPITVFGYTYPSAEHAFQAQKARTQKAHDHIADAPSPGHAKRRGRRCMLISRWDEQKLGIMEEILRAKFAPGSALAKRLKATEGRELIEGNAWGDLFWGVDVTTGRGKNHLGKLLMQIRDEL